MKREPSNKFVLKPVKEVSAGLIIPAEEGVRTVAMEEAEEALRLHRATSVRLRRRRDQARKESTSSLWYRRS